MDLMAAGAQTRLGNERATFTGGGQAAGRAVGPTVAVIAVELGWARGPLRGHDLIDAVSGTAVGVTAMNSSRDRGLSVGARLGDRSSHRQNSPALASGRKACLTAQASSSKGEMCATSRLVGRRVQPAGPGE